MTLPPIDTVALFPAERAALLDLLAGLTAEEWRRPTVCAGWCVHDVALHLLGGDIGYLSRHRDGFFGGAGDRGPATWDELVAFVDGLNDAWLRGARRMSPRLVTTLLLTTGEELAAYLQAIDLRAAGDAVSWAGEGPAPRWLDVAREYTERWVHQQQIRDAVGQPGLTEPRFFAPVLDAFARALPHALRYASAPEGTRVRLVITGAAGGRWTAVRLDERWRLVADHAAPAAASVTIDQDLAWRLFTKGVRPEQTVGRIRVEGDTALTDPVVLMVTIIA